MKKGLLQLVLVCGLLGCGGDDAVGNSGSGSESSSDSMGTDSMGTDSMTSDSMTSDSMTSGASSGAGPGPADCTTPADSPLSLVWSWTLDQQGSMGPLWVGSDGVATLGGTLGDGSLTDTVWLGRVDADGGLVWAVDGGFAAQSSLRDVVVDDAGSTYAVGFTLGMDPAFGIITQLLMVAVEPDGTMRWTDATPVLDDRPLTSPEALALAPDGTVVVVGMDGAAEGFLRRYDPDGTIAATISLADVSPSDVSVDAAGDTFVVGTSGVEPVAVRLDPAGVELWSSANPGPGEDNFFEGTSARVALSVDGPIVLGRSGFLVGNPMMPTDSWTELWVHALDPMGGARWDTRFDYEDYPQSSLVIDGTGTIYAAVRQLSEAPYIRQLASDGTPGWETAPPCPVAGFTVATDGADLWVSGSGPGDVADAQPYLVRYTQR